MKVKLKVTDNPYNLPLDLLFSMAARINRKRRFLFVSKVLGKHVPVRNVNSLLTGVLLAYKFLEDYYGQSSSITMEILHSYIKKEEGNAVWEKVISNPVKLKDEVLFVAFAETATALGHAVFSCFKNTRFIHSTREIIPDFENMIVFEEEHSHATSHRVYPLDPGLMNSDSPVVFIDDEISTGKTVLNIIKEMNRICPRKEYIVLSILDFRSKADRDLLREFEQEQGVNVTFVSLVSGELEAELQDHFQSWEEVDAHLQATLSMNPKHPSGNEIRMDTKIRYLSLNRFFKDFIHEPSVNELGEVNSIPYLKFTGRFGMNSEDTAKLNHAMQKIAGFLSQEIKGDKVLFLGTEEFIYIPLGISSFLNKDIYFHSTTRSPIYLGTSLEYPVKNVFRFACPANTGVTNYVYNIPYGFYDEAYLFFERGFAKDGLELLLNAIPAWGMKKVTILTCSGEII